MAYRPYRERALYHSQEKQFCTRKLGKSYTSSGQFCEGAFTVHPFTRKSISHYPTIAAKTKQRTDILCDRKHLCFKVSKWRSSENDRFYLRFKVSKLSINLWHTFIFSWAFATNISLWERPDRGIKWKRQRWIERGRDKCKGQSEWELFTCVNN